MYKLVEVKVPCGFLSLGTFLHSIFLLRQTGGLRLGCFAT